MHNIDPPIASTKVFGVFIESNENHGVITIVVRNSVAVRVILVDEKIDFMIPMIHSFK
jgi:hypothetical protein